MDIHDQTSRNQTTKPWDVRSKLIIKSLDALNRRSLEQKINETSDSFRNVAKNYFVKLGYDPPPKHLVITVLRARILKISFIDPRG